MTIPPRYTEEQQIVGNFSVTEIATGTGLARFFGCSERRNANYFFTQNAVDSSKAFTDVGTSTEINFDLDFEVDALIRGLCFVSYSTNQDTGAGNYGNTVRLLHVDEAGTETQLGELSGSQMSNAGSSERNLLTFDLARRNVHKGEKIRVEWRGVAASGNGVVHHDPNNRESTANNDATNVKTAATQDTTFILDLPFIIP